MISVDVVSECSLWSKKIRKKKLFFKNLVTFFPKKYRFIKKKVSLTVLLSNNQSIKRLNKKFRNKNKPTDVLSFPIKSNFNKNYKGDIAICYEIINLRSKKTNFSIEFDKMWIHGLLHLLGYNHVKLKDYKQMLRREQDILKKVN